MKYELLKGGRLYVCPRLVLLAFHVQTIHVQFRKLCTETLSSVDCVGMYTYNYLFQHYSTVTIIRSPQLLLGHVGNCKMSSTHLNM